jgi:NAD(P)-dependent dehydrogenase (short-subunit alcohol dehydrogenase family)
MKKVAIVTGASRGIGRAVAKRLAQDGFTVVVNYMSNAAEAEEVVAELKGIGGNAVAIQADVSSPPDVERLFNETSTKFGSVDLVVHNSGIMPLSPIGKNDFDLFDKVISTNLPRSLPGVGASRAAHSIWRQDYCVFEQRAGEELPDLWSLHCLEGRSRRLGTRLGKRAARPQCFRKRCGARAGRDRTLPERQERRANR